MVNSAGTDEVTVAPFAVSQSADVASSVDVFATLLELSASDGVVVLNVVVVVPVVSTSTIDGVEDHVPSSSMVDTSTSMAVVVPVVTSGVDTAELVASVAVMNSADTCVVSGETAVASNFLLMLMMSVCDTEVPVVVGCFAVVTSDGVILVISMLLVVALGTA